MKQYLVRIALLALVALVVSSCSQSEMSKVEDRPTISVKAEVLKPRDVQVTRTFTGSLEGEKQAVIYAKVAEAVEAVYVKEGQNVAANTILVALDKTGPSSNYLQTKSLFANAEKNYKKMEYLFGEGAVSETQYDAARTDYEVQKASFDAVSQLVDIPTPIAGMVTSIMVSEGDFAKVGQKLATVASTGKLRVKIGVNSDDIGSFAVGTRVIVSSEAVKSVARGEVVTVATSADPVTRSFEVQALIDNAAGNYKPGMFVRISIVLEDLKNVMAVPRRSVVVLDDKNTVFTISNGKAVKKEVTLGPDIDGHVVITSGVAVGDTVVTLGQDYLDEGYDVKIASLSEGDK